MTAVRPSDSLGSLTGGRSPRGQHGLRRFGGAFVAFGEPATELQP